MVVVDHCGRLDVFVVGDHYW